jgi:hypothetical protein
MTSKSYDKPECSIEEVLDVVRKIVKRENDIDIISIATEIFLKRSRKEMFVTLKEP